MKELVREMFQNYTAYETSAQDVDVILNANENSVDVFADTLLQRAVEEMKTLQVNRYPETTSRRLREAYAEYLGVDADNLICGVGSDEIIRIVCDLVLENGDKAAGFFPSFSMYDFFTEVAKGKFIHVDMRENNMQGDIDALIECANTEQAKIIFLCNPNNPTGQLFTREEIMRVLENTSALVVLDEAYIEFALQSSVDLIHSYDRLLVLRTLSKAFACAGMRVGFGVGSRELISRMVMAAPPYNLNIFSQVFGRLMIENRAQTTKLVQGVCALREQFYAFLKSLPGLYVYPSQANFLFFQTPRAKELVQALEKNKISIRTYKAPLETYLRISIGTKEEMERAKIIFERVFL